jgi:hypothetical protein
MIIIYHEHHDYVRMLSCMYVCLNYAKIKSILVYSSVCVYIGTCV